MGRRRAGSIVAWSAFLVVSAWWIPVCGPPLASAGQAKVQIVRNMSVEALPIYQQAFDLFEAKTGIKVEGINAPGSQVAKWEQVTTMVAGGISPDLVDAISTEFVQYAATGLIEPYDRFVARDRPDASRLNGRLLDALKWRGNQYVMPYGASGLAFVYNPAFFDESGLARPPASWSTAEWRWEGFMEVARKLTRSDQGGRITRFGVGGGLGGWIDSGYHFGADWVTPDLKRWTGSGEPMVNALATLQDLPWRYHVSPRPGENGTFRSQLSAMAVEGTWSLPALVRSEFHWRVAPWPQVGNHAPVGIIYPVGMTLLSSSKHKEEAWQLVKFLTTDPEANYLWAKAAGAVPMVLAGIPRWARELESARPDSNSIAFGEQVRVHGAVIRVRMLTTFGQIDAVMNRVFNQIMSEGKPAKLAMDEVKDQMQGFVDEAAR